METQLVEFIERLLTMITDLTAVPYAVALVTLLVSLVKRLPFMTAVSAPTIHLVIQVIFWVIYAVLTHFGQGEQLQEWTQAITILLQTLLPLIASMFGGKWLYSKAESASVPLWGYRRS